MDNKGNHGGFREGAGRKKIPIVEFKDIPEKKIILDQVIYWINLQATAKEIAGSFHVSVDTLYNRLKEEYGLDFSELYKRVEGGAKLSLRKYQFDQAKKGSTMAIWLGKQWLGQKDHETEQEKTSQINPNLEALHHVLSENKKLQDRINVLESKANQELPRSDTSL